MEIKRCPYGCYKIIEDMRKSHLDNMMKAIELITKIREEKSPTAVELGRRGGLKGGYARAKSLTPKERTRIAVMAARARWKGSRCLSV